MTSLVLITGPPASGKTTLAVPRLGAASFAVMLALLRQLPAAVAEAPFAAASGPELLAICERPIEVFCRCPPPEVMRRYLARAPSRHPGHLDHQMAPEIRGRLEQGAGPLGLGGPLLEVDTTQALDVAAIAKWVISRRNAP
jgi:hypothetical protein